MNITLQTLRKYAKKPADIDAGKNDNKPIFYWFGDLLPYSWADDCEGGPRHTGWYTNNDGACYKDGSGKCRGVVIQLPPCPGFADGRYLAGYWWGDNGEFVAWPELFKDETEAARKADSHAENYAESAREDNARFEAMREAEDEVTHICARLRKYLPARNVTVTLREEVRSMIEELRDARNTLKARTGEYEGV